jgi:uncharacterized protein YyaL (SSP411 family)
LNSRIFNGEAYVAYYYRRRQNLVYPEITAYAISLSCMLFKRNKKREFLERAEKCAEYMSRINKQGAVPNFADNLSYTFDTGIFISAMFDLHSLTKDDSYLKQASRSLDWLYSLWNGRYFYAVDQLPKEREWYHRPSVHLVKLAIPLLKAAKSLGNKRHEATALTLLQEYKQLQEEDGRFRLNQDSAITMAHPHCYATEGYLYAYHATQNKEFLDIAFRAGDWLRKMQNKDGSLYQIYYSQEEEKYHKVREKLKTADATAQATRIWKLLSTNEDNIQRAYKYLNSELSGGLRLFRNESLGGKLLSWRRPIYSWPTFFLIHSLSLPFGEMSYIEELF